MISWNPTEVNEDTAERRIERAMEVLIDDLSAATDRDTGIVRFSITTSDPLLSQGVAAPEPVNASETLLGIN